MKQHAYMLVFDGLADWEPAYALCALSRSGKHQVRTVGFSPDPIRTMGGLKVIPDLTLSEVKPTDAAIFILPGGDRWEQIPDAGSGSGLHDLLHRLHVERVPIAAICGATLELARAGLTRGVRHTSNAKEYLKAMVPEYQDDGFYVDAPAVSDHNLITASVTGSLEFTREIMKQLQLHDEAEIEAWYHLFKYGASPSQAAA
jgi:putative intracellular protease/amidase